MAGESKVTLQKQPQGRDPLSPTDCPLLDLSDAAIKNSSTPPRSGAT